MINAVKDADLNDFSLGFVKKWISPRNVRKVMEQTPNYGFHKTLLTIGPEIHAANVFKIVGELGKIFYW